MTLVQQARIARNTVMLLEIMIICQCEDAERVQRRLSPALLRLIKLTATAHPSGKFRWKADISSGRMSIGLST